MLGKKYEDRTIFDHTDEFCNFMENCHGDRELGRKWYLVVKKEGREYLELWSEQWGGRVRLAYTSGNEQVRGQRHGLHNDR